MKNIIIYHNPRCSKSREALEIIKNQGFEPIIVEYLKTPLDITQLKELRSHFELKDLVRINEPLFKTLKLSLDREEELLRTMVKNPILMQRPIVTYNGKAVIGRPPENVLELFTP